MRYCNYKSDDRTITHGDKVARLYTQDDNEDILKLVRNNITGIIYTYGSDPIENSEQTVNNVHEVQDEYGINIPCYYVGRNNFNNRYPNVPTRGSAIVWSHCYRINDEQLDRSDILNLFNAVYKDMEWYVKMKREQEQNDQNHLNELTLFAELTAKLTTLSQNERNRKLQVILDNFDNM